MNPISIRTRLILLIAAISTGLLAGILVAVSGSLNREVRRKAISDFDKTQDFFRRQEMLIYDRLVESSLLIGQNAAFKANVALADPPSVQQAVEEFAGFTKTDLMVVTDMKGTSLAWLDRPGAIGENLLSRPGRGAALAGQEPGWMLEDPTLWEVDSQLYQVVSVPIRVNAIQLGTITLGARFTDFEAMELKGKSDVEISIFLADKLVGTSISDSVLAGAGTHLQDFHRRYRAEIGRALAGGVTSPVFPASFSGMEVFAFVQSLGEGAPGYYLAMTEKSRQLGLLRTLLRTIIFIGLGGFLLAVLLAFVLGNRFTQPVLALVRAMEEVRRGELNTALPVRSRDEYGRLTEAFNEMVKVMRERLHLAKYVGSHTLRMIRAEEAESGRRLQLAALFSDIRGFTAYAETREPEIVIEMLNVWLGFQADAVEHFGGVVDKYAGDEVFALFTGPDAMERAYRCARQIQDKAGDLARRQHEALGVGIGLNFGPAVMGNVGAESRLDYTVIGASVNLAARLCAAARSGEVLLPLDIARKLRLDIVGFEQEELAFKGISKPVEVVRIRNHHDLHLR